MERKNQKVSPTIANLQVGETATFPIAKLRSVRVQASEMGAILGRQFVTRSDRENQIVVVARVG